MQLTTCPAAEGSSTPTKSEEQLAEHEMALHGGNKPDVAVGEANGKAHSKGNMASNGNDQVCTAYMFVHRQHVCLICTSFCCSCIRGMTALKAGVHAGGGQEGHVPGV